MTHDLLNRDKPCVVGILAGGQSRRMGEPKALLAHPDGETLIEHVVRVASEVADDVVILGRSCPLPTSIDSLPVLPDAEPDAGPLGALCALLEYAGKASSRVGGRGLALMLGCDMPLLTPAVLRRLLSKADDAADAAVFARDAQARTFHPCCALYHPRILPTARWELTEGGRSLHRLLERIRTTVLNPSPDEVRQLTNINTPEDHARLREERRSS